MLLSRSTLLHLRVPFSFFLMPVFWWALVSAEMDWAAQWPQVALAFVCLHLFIYPASNGYNSYYDRDEGSIGGLEKPPTVTEDLWWVAFAFDAAGIGLGLLVNWPFAAMLLAYSLVSRAYSYDKIRLKKYPVISWLVVGFFQGAFTFAMTRTAVSDGLSLAQMGEQGYWVGAVLSSALIMGGYPLTQVYQHEEDARRGDRTLSLLLGIRGTFVFVALFFGATVAGFTAHLWFAFPSAAYAIVLHVCLLPTLAFFVWWARGVFRDVEAANFRNVMRMNLLSGVCLNGCFLLMLLVKNGLLFA